MLYYTCKTWPPLNKRDLNVKVLFTGTPNAVQNSICCKQNSWSRHLFTNIFHYLAFT